MFKRTVEHSSVRGLQEMRMTCVLVSAAKNSLRRKFGFSPSQWVCGTEPRLPGELADDGENLAANWQARDPQSEVARRFCIREAAHHAFVEMQNDEGLRRAALRQARVKKGPYEIGEMVFFYRKAGDRGDWRGPAVVIGQEGENVWVSFAGRAFLCAREHLRVACPDELWGMAAEEEVKEDLRTLGQKLREGDSEYKDERRFRERAKAPGAGGDESGYRAWSRKKLQSEAKARGLASSRRRLELATELEEDDRRKRARAEEAGDPPELAAGSGNPPGPTALPAAAAGEPGAPA
jgi:hypothetical protein